MGKQKPYSDIASIATSIPVTEMGKLKLSSDITPIATSVPVVETEKQKLSSDITPIATSVPVVEMGKQKLSSDITPIATSAVESSTKQSRSVPKRCTFKRMIYGFAFTPEELEEWGRQRFGDTDDEKILDGYMGRSMSALFDGCYRLWRRTSMHFVNQFTGARRHESDWCLTFADNISPDTEIDH